MLAKKIARKVLTIVKRNSQNFVASVFSCIGIARFALIRRRNSIRRRNALGSKETIFSFDQHQVFFGYYDIQPLHNEGDKVLAHVGRVPLQSPLPGSGVSVGWFERLGDDEWNFREIATTPLWCWQLGSRLRWYPDPDSSEIAFNTLNPETATPSLAIVDTYGGDAKYLPFTAYDISSDGRHVLTLDFARLQRLRPGYGYAGIVETDQGTQAPENNGVFLGNVETEEKVCLFSLSELSRIEPHDSMITAEHYVNHLSFSPSGDRFIFLHLWVNAGKRYSRLFASETAKPSPVLLQNESPVSHYAWKDDHTVIVFAKIPGTSEQGLMLYDLESGFSARFAEGLISHDGHPSFIDHDHLLYDTYPDRYRNQHLLVYDLARSTRREIGSFYRPWKYTGEVRCDLHPRYSSKHQ